MLSSKIVVIKIQGGAPGGGSGGWPSGGGGGGGWPSGGGGGNLQSNTIWFNFRTSYQDFMDEYVKYIFWDYVLQKLRQFF